MSTIESTESFLSRLERSKLLSRSQIFQAIDDLDLSASPSAREAAKSLIRSQLLTRFQARELLNDGPWRVKIDDYTLLELIGSGGMGRIFAAEETSTKWRVAVKVLADHLRSDTGIVARFQLEAEIGMRLKHHNVLCSRKIDETEDLYGAVHYMVMDFFRGITVNELLDQTSPIPWRQAADIFMQAAAGLAHLHDNRIIHRDVKPSNIMAASDGSVKILDYGLSRIDEDDQEFSMAMIFGHDRMGTADYIAPEQIEDSYLVDKRADVYSLGCSFYHALTGVPPFRGSTVNEKLLGHRKQAPKSIRAIAPDVPAELEKVVARMLAKKPKNRTSSAEAVVTALQPFAERAPINFEYSKILRERIQDDQRRSTFFRNRSDRKP